MGALAWLLRRLPGPGKSEAAVATVRDHLRMVEPFVEINLDRSAVKPGGLRRGNRFG